MGDVSYPICRDWTGDADIDSTAALRDWIEERAERYEIEVLSESPYLNGPYDPTADIGGIKYLSKTFGWSNDNHCFTQSGSGPSYFGGIYTLATCAWHKRGTAEFEGRGPSWYFDEHFTRVSDKYNLYQPQYPVLVVNSGKCETPYDVDGAYWVTSVAFVTHAFSTVEGYAQFLHDHFDGPEIKHRLTHSDKTTEYNRQIGDCHADRNADTDGPPIDHDHHEGTKSDCGCGTAGRYEQHPDNWDTHLKCLSLEDFWYPFQDPVFKWANRGTKIDSRNLESQGLKEVV